mmetsp:Transcript_8912/g.22405  ORF Transcript_8912/g.22405 Transcript_8912/m.22405 type:complete len:246 (+) Transcript_8912:221-958(+)
MLRRVFHVVRAAQRGEYSPRPDVIYEHPGVKWGMYRSIPDYKDAYSKHRTVVPLKEEVPFFQPTCFVAPSATLVGNVELFDHASVWYGSVLRAEHRAIQMGAYSRVHENCVVDTAFEDLNDDHDGSVVIGHFVTVGPNSLLRATTIEDNVHIGPNCILLDGSYVETNCMLAPGTLLPVGARVSTGQLWAGNPGKYVRDLTPEEVDWLVAEPEAFVPKSKQHIWEYELPGCYDQYIEAEQKGFLEK